MPVSFKMDSLLAKAEPISNSGSTSRITDLGRGKNCWKQQLEEKSENMWEKRIADTKVSEEGEEEVLQALELRFIPL